MAGALAVQPETAHDPTKLNAYELSMLPKVHRDQYDLDDAESAPTGEASTPEVPVETTATPALQSEPTVQPPAPAVSADVDARFARLENEMASMREQHSATERALADARNENAQLRSELEAAKATPPAPPIPSELKSREDYEKAYGLSPDESDMDDGTLSGIRKMIVAEVESRVDAKLAGAINRINTEVDSKFAAHGNVVAQGALAARKQFNAERAALIPDYDEINDDPAFEGWLNGIDVGTRVKRRTLVQAAQNDMDAESLAVWFDRFRIETGRKKPEAKKAVNLESQVTPPPRGGGATQTPPAAPKRQYTNGEYLKETNRAIQLRATNPKAADALEAELDAAMQEGRVSG